MFKFNRSQPIPILVLSDAPSIQGGLSRVARDLCDVLVSMPEFRVGSLGRGGVERRGFSWMQYQYPESAQWGEEYIEDVWNDFSGGRDGIIFSNWDLSRLFWFSQPNSGLPAPLQRFLGEGRSFAKWAYTPIDATGPNGRTLPMLAAAAAAGFDKLAVSSRWGCDVLQSSGRPDADWLPHGLWLSRDFKRDEEAKAKLGWEGKIVLGCVMTNQFRKDWAAAFECAQAMKAHYGNKFFAWFHTDTPERYWSFPGLAADYGLGQEDVRISVSLTDAQLAVRYSACDCTILPSRGEGFGFPIAESMACGVPCIVTDYGAGQELVDERHKVKPMCYHVDTPYNLLRAVISGYGFAQKAIEAIEYVAEDPEYRHAELRDNVMHLDWPQLSNTWKKWFKEGLNSV